MASLEIMILRKNKKFLFSRNPFLVVIIGTKGYLELGVI
jgi:hypothetical protein